MKLRSMFSILGLFAVFSFSACNKDDEMESIIGVWQSTSADIEITADELPVPYKFTDENFDATVEFKEDGVVSVDSDGQLNSGTYEIQGSTLVTTANVSTNFTDLTGTFAIKKLTKTILVLYISHDDELDIPGQGLVDGTMKATIHFERVQ